MSSTEQRTTEVALYVPSTGEMLTIAVDAAPSEQLADAIEPTVGVIARIRRDLAAVEEMVADELVDRSDQALQGTLRYGKPEDGVQFEVVVPSESAGTEGWYEDKVEEALAELVASLDGITDEGAAQVIVHEVVAKFRVTTRAQALALVEELKADKRTVRAEHASRLDKRGMNTLLKRAVCAAAVEGARKPAGDPPKRRPKVRRIDRRAA